MNVGDAMREAQITWNGQLVHIDDQPEQDFITKTILSGKLEKVVAWIGATDRENEDQWRWSDGRPLSYTKWYKNEPNDWGKKGEDAVAMNWHYGEGHGSKSTKGQWNDFDEWHKYFGLVEIEGTGLGLDGGCNCQDCQGKIRTGACAIGSCDVKKRKCVAEPASCVACDDGNKLTIGDFCDTNKKCIGEEPAWECLSVGDPHQYESSQNNGKGAWKDYMAKGRYLLGTSFSGVKVEAEAYVCRGSDVTCNRRVILTTPGGTEISVDFDSFVLKNNGRPVKNSQDRCNPITIDGVECYQTLQKTAVRFAGKVSGTGRKAYMCKKDNDRWMIWWYPWRGGDAPFLNIQWYNTQGGPPTGPGVCGGGLLTYPDLDCSEGQCCEPKDKKKAMECCKPIFDKKAPGGKGGGLYEACLIDTCNGDECDLGQYKEVGDDAGLLDCKNGDAGEVCKPKDEPVTKKVLATRVAPCNDMQPANPPNGKFEKCKNVDHGKKCELDCNPGFKEAGDAVCNNGKFVMPPSPMCIAKPCEDLPQMTDHGRYTGPTPVQPGKKATLNCDKGYMPSDDGAAVCDAGKWIEKDTCEPKPCADGPGYTVKDGSFATCRDTPHGGTCALTCKSDKFKKTGDAECLKGEWTKEKCLRTAPDDCDDMPQPNPAHGSYDRMCAGGVMHGGKCKLKCDKGYMPTGPAICEGGDFVLPPDPGCAPKPCKDPMNPAKGKWAVNPDKTRATLTCDKGYKPSDDGVTTCNLGTWDGPDTCEPKNCVDPPAPVDNGQLAPNCANSPHGAKCALTCQTNFDKTGDPECDKGEWTPETCHRVRPDDCHGMPTTNAIPNGKFHDCKSVPSGDSCPLMCDKGYQPSGDADCDNGRYTLPVDPMCSPIPCTDPMAPANGQLMCDAKNTQCTLTCDKGFQPTGIDGGRQRCELGQWVDEDDCEPADCVDAPSYSVAKGQFARNCANTPNGGYCTLTCDRNFGKTADARCDHGDWSVEKCNRVAPDDCSGMPFPNPSNGHYAKCGTVPSGDACPLICDRGHTPTGDAECDNGQYRMPASPGCSPDQCTTPMPIANGQWKCDPANTNCQLKCDATFEPSDDGYMMCRLGSWVDEDTCEPLMCKEGPMNPPNGQYVARLPAMDGAKAPLVCSRGNVPSGDGMAVCKEGKWTELDTCAQPADSCTQGACDIAMVVDRAYSTDDNKQFAIDLIQKIKAHYQDPQIAIIRFSGRPTMSQTLTNDDQLLHDAISQWPGRAGRQVDAHEAIMMARQHLRSAGRPDATCIKMYVLLDHPSSRPKATQSEADKARNQGVYVFGVGAGKASQPELDAIANPPAGTNIAIAPTWRETDEALNKDDVCLDGAPCVEVPADPSLGRWTCSAPVAHGGTCNLQCDHGLAPGSDGLAECTNGRWPDADDQCKALDDCATMPPAAEYGDWDCDLPVKSGMGCQLNCPFGPEVGDLVTTCEDGRWVSPDEDKCKPNVCPNEEFMFNDGKYSFTPTPVTWKEAQLAALNKGGRLAVINTEDEADFIKNTVLADGRENNHYWFGLTASDLANPEWQWIDQSPMQYTDWEDAGVPAATRGLAAALNDEYTVTKEPFYLGKWGPEDMNRAMCGLIESPPALICTCLSPRASECPPPPECQTMTSQGTVRSFVKCDTDLQTDFGDLYEEVDPYHYHSDLNAGWDCVPAPPDMAKASCGVV